MSILKGFFLFLLYHQRKYNEILKKTSFDSLDDTKKISIPDIRYQGYCSFYTKNYYHSQSCFEILKNEDRLKSIDCNYLAYMYARHNEKDKAISTWCIALEKNSFNKLAKISLDYLRNKGRDINLVEDNFFEMIMPKEPFLFPVKRIFITAVIIIFIAGLSASGYYIFNYAKDYIQNKKMEKELDISKIKLPDFNPNLLDKIKDEKSKYSYSEKELKKKFDNIKNLIISNKTVEAQIEINQIKLSNASAKVKLRVEMLETFIKEPDYAFFDNIISYEIFDKEKNLYENIYVIWNGSVKNRIIGRDMIEFNLFIGNDDKGIVTGIVPVIFKTGKIINNNENVYVFGRIKKNKDVYYLNGLFIINSKEYESYKQRINK